MASLSRDDFDEAFLIGQNMFTDVLEATMRQIFEPVALDAFAQQVRQLPEPVQAALKRKAPEAWREIFGDST